MTTTTVTTLSERLYSILGHKGFLSMQGLANEVPIFIQTYDPKDEDDLRRMVDSLAGRLLHTLIGYSQAPNGAQLIAYGATIVMILVLMRLVNPPRQKHGQA